MINWKKLVKRIPHKLQVGKNDFYNVAWVTAFDDATQLGEFDASRCTLSIKQNQSDKEKVLTYLHEVIHCFSDINGIGLTERQVSLLEKKCLYYVLKSDNIFMQASSKSAVKRRRKRRK